MLRKPLAGEAPPPAPQPADGDGSVGGSSESGGGGGGGGANAAAAQKLAGTWETVIPGGTSSFKFSGSQLEYVSRGLRGNVLIAGPFRVTSSSGTRVQVSVDGKTADGNEAKENYTIEFTGDDQIGVSGGSVGDSPVNYKRKGPGGPEA